MAETTNQTVSSEYDDLKLENQLCFPLYAASREVVKQYTPYLKPLGLTYTQYITLMVLWQEKKLRVGDLGHKLFLDTGTLTPLLKKMEEAGLVCRTRSAHDERVVEVEITRKGMALREQLKDIPKQVGTCVKLSKEDARILVNPSGKFALGGPAADTGLTGRKLAVDQYGPVAHIGGGALSGKDPTKVDRSGAYAARWVAKNIVAAGMAKRCEVQIAYAIGKSEPVSVTVDSFGTGVISDSCIEAAVKAVFDLTPAGIIRDLKLNRPIYSKLACYGHFGRTELELPWEKINRKYELLSAALKQSVRQ